MAVDDAYTKVLLHFNGTDGSTTFTDESGKVWTAAGNAQLDTASFVFGNAAGLFDGAGDYISTPDHADFACGTGNYTIDLWFKTTAADGWLFYQGDSAGNASACAHFVFITANKLNWSPNYRSYPSQSTLQSIGTVNDGGWHHCACVRNGDVFTLYLDGVQQATVTLAGYNALDSAEALFIGQMGAGGVHPYAGSIDEVRFSLGVARWTGNFTPPSVEYGAAAQQYEETVAETFNAADVIGEIHNDVLEDGFALAESVDTDDFVIEDTFGIDMTEPADLPPVILSLGFLVDDIIDMPDSVTENPISALFCFETFFFWDELVWGWDHLIAESLVNTDALQEILSEMADEYFLLEDAQVPGVKVQHIVNDTVFGFDDLNVERYYLILADETIEMTDGEVNFLADSINEALGINEGVSPQTVFTGLATESLVFADISGFMHEIIIEEGLALGDVDLMRWVYSVLIESGFDITDAFD